MPSLLPVLALALLAGTFEPARLERGGVDASLYGARSAGLVLLEVGVDARGGVGDSRVLKDVAPFTDLLRDAVRGWSFVPARNGGVAVDSHVLVAGLFRPPMLMVPAPETPSAAAGDTLEAPRPQAVTLPPYPPNAVGSATVLVELELAESGEILAANTLGATSGFDAAALEAARGWSFTPARRDGRAVPARVYVVFTFEAPVGG
jgi:TonB family protein